MKHFSCFFKVKFCISSSLVKALKERQLFNHSLASESPSAQWDPPQKLTSAQASFCSEPSASVFTSDTIWQPGVSQLFSWSFPHPPTLEHHALKTKYHCQTCFKHSPRLCSSLSWCELSISTRVSRPDRQSWAKTSAGCETWHWTGLGHG